jgi:hypothetical protein
MYIRNALTAGTPAGGGRRTPGAADTPAGGGQADTPAGATLHAAGAGGHALYQYSILTLPGVGEGGYGGRPIEQRGGREDLSTSSRAL